MILFTFLVYNLKLAVLIFVFIHAKNLKVNRDKDKFSGSYMGGRWESIFVNWKCLKSSLYRNDASYIINCWASVSFPSLPDIKDLIHLVTLGGKFLALAGLCNSVVVWRFEEGSGRWKRHINLPKYINPPTAMRIHSASQRLVVVYLDGKLIEYDLEELQFTFSVHIQEGSLKRSIMNLALDPRDPNLFILQDEETIFSIRKLQEIEEDTENIQERKKVKKTKRLDDKEKFTKKIIRETKVYNFIVFSVKI